MKSKSCLPLISHSGDGGGNIIYHNINKHNFGIYLQCYSFISLWCNYNMLYIHDIPTYILRIPTLYSLYPWSKLRVWILHLLDIIQIMLYLCHYITSERYPQNHVGIICICYNTGESIDVSKLYKTHQN